MSYRTRVYIAADWDNDKAVVDKLREWNDSDYYVIDFTDAHDLTQANDSSLPCSIKATPHILKKYRIQKKNTRQISRV